MIEHGACATRGSTRRAFAATILSGLWAAPPLCKAQGPGGGSRFEATLQRVSNRGTAPVEFLTELVEWGLHAPDEIFVANRKVDIYSRVLPALGPWQGLRHRRAVMLEVLRVLGGFESSWTWNAGVDVTNPKSNTPCTEEAGMFQCSADSMHFSKRLRDLLMQAGGDDKCDTFRRVTKANHPFAIEYCARLLRETVQHHGPVRDRLINRWLRRNSVEEFSRLL